MINKTKILDYLLVYLLVAFSGIPFFYRARIEVLIAFLAIPLGVFVYRKCKLDKFIVYYLAFVLLLQMGQVLKFYYLPVSTFLGLHARLLFAYFTIKALGEKFIGHYINVLFFSVVVSLLLYLMSYSSGFEQFLKQSVAPIFKHPFLKESNYVYSPNIIFYTLNTKGEGFIWLKRNSGPFWEPGAFAGFLIVALLLSVMVSKRLWTKKNMVLIAGLISAFSTTGLIALCYVIVVYYLAQKDLVKRGLVVPLLLVSVTYLFFSVDFLGDKVVEKMSYSNKTYNTRFKSAMTDLEDLTKSPLVGLGRSDVTRFDEEQDSRKIHRNNGVSNLLATYGIIGFVLYFLLMLTGFKKVCKQSGFNHVFALYALAGICIIGFSEVYFTKVLFLALTMLPVIYGRSPVSEEGKEAVA